MQAIVYALLSRGNDHFQHISNYSPFFEIDPHWELSSDGKDGRFASKFDCYHAEIRCRVFNTHLRWALLPKGPQAKYIYIYRNGKDVVTSFYHHLSNQDDSGGYSGTFDQFFDDWTQNKIIFGSWINHLKEFMEAAKDPLNNILVMRYEDMKTNLGDSVLRIADFLKCPLEKEFINTHISPKVTFECMKENQEKYQPISVKWKNNFEFIRKGLVGDSSSIFSPEQHKIFDEMIKNEFPNGPPAWLR